MFISYLELVGFIITALLATLFCCGHFHSDYHLGIPYQLQKNHLKLKIAVIARASSVQNLFMRDRSKVADFIWVEE